MLSLILVAASLVAPKDAVVALLQSKAVTGDHAVPICVNVEGLAFSRSELLTVAPNLLPAGDCTYRTEPWLGTTLVYNGASARVLTLKHFARVADGTVSVEFENRNHGKDAFGGTVALRLTAEGWRIAEVSESWQS